MIGLVTVGKMCVYVVGTIKARSEFSSTGEFIRYLHSEQVYLPNGFGISGDLGALTMKTILTL